MRQHRQLPPPHKPAPQSRNPNPRLPSHTTTLKTPEPASPTPHQPFSRAAGDTNPNSLCPLPASVPPPVSLQGRQESKPRPPSHTTTPGGPQPKSPRLPANKRRHCASTPLLGHSASHPPHPRRQGPISAPRPCPSILGYARVQPVLIMSLVAYRPAASLVRDLSKGLSVLGTTIDQSTALIRRNYVSPAYRGRNPLVHPRKRPRRIRGILRRAPRLEPKGRLGNNTMSCFNVGDHNILLCERSAPVDGTEAEDGGAHHSFTVTPEVFEQACREFHSRNIRIDHLTYRARGFLHRPRALLL